ncbi:E1-E2 ATPase-domain-containing protein [Tribonema minus]|uniref:E1-E2 ATPase-domain-containing protein n=1 Tax=Tribonema minus TaxID=303371 RepID=A0A835ZC41_9STRA|nr:E1-E2 ATPase-domain-containing protein [Tribonema minus]
MPGTASEASASPGSDAVKQQCNSSLSGTDRNTPLLPPPGLPPGYPPGAVLHPGHLAGFPPMLPGAMHQLPPHMLGHPLARLGMQPVLLPPHHQYLSPQDQAAALAALAAAGHGYPMQAHPAMLPHMLQQQMHMPGMVPGMPLPPGYHHYGSPVRWPPHTPPQRRAPLPHYQQPPLQQQQQQASQAPQASAASAAAAAPGVPSPLIGAASMPPDAPAAMAPHAPHPAVPTQPPPQPQRHDSASPQCPPAGAPPLLPPQLHLQHHQHAAMAAAAAAAQQHLMLQHPHLPPGAVPLGAMQPIMGIPPGLELGGPGGLPPGAIMGVPGGAPVLMEAPATNQELMERKLQKRAANRRSAQLSRQRKKAFIDDLRSQNEALRRQEEILDVVPDPVFAFNVHDGLVWFASKSAAAQFGLRVDDLLDANFFDLVTLDCSNRLHALISRALEDDADGASVLLRERMTVRFRKGGASSNVAMLLGELSGRLNRQDGEVSCVCSVRLLSLMFDDHADAQRAAAAFAAAAATDYNGDQSTSDMDQDGGSQSSSGEESTSVGSTHDSSGATTGSGSGNTPPHQLGGGGGGSADLGSIPLSTQAVDAHGQGLGGPMDARGDGYSDSVSQESGGNDGDDENLTDTDCSSSDVTSEQSTASASESSNRKRRARDEDGGGAADVALAAGGGSDSRHGGGGGGSGGGNVSSSSSSSSSGKGKTTASGHSSSGSSSRSSEKRKSEGGGGGDADGGSALQPPPQVDPSALLCSPLPPSSSTPLIATGAAKDVGPKRPAAAAAEHAPKRQRLHHHHGAADGGGAATVAAPTAGVAWQLQHAEHKQHAVHKQHVDGSEHRGCSAAAAAQAGAPVAKGAAVAAAAVAASAAAAGVASAQHGTVEKALERVDGIIDVSVHLNPGSARVVVSEGAAVSAEQLVSLVEALGYDAEHRLVAGGAIVIESCCKFEGARGSDNPDEEVGDLPNDEPQEGPIPGVMVVTVSLPMGQADVDFDAAVTGPAEIAAAIRAAGYSAKAVPSGAGDDEEMALQVARREERAKKHLVSAALQLAFSLLFTVPLVAVMLSMGDVFMFIGGGSGDKQGGGMMAGDSGGAKGGLYKELAPGLDVSTVVQWALATPVQFISGAPFYRQSFHDIKRRTLSMHFLIASGTSAAYIYSVLLVFLGLASGVTHSDSLFFDTGAVLISFILMGKLLELFARRGASNAITKLMSLRPETAVLLSEWPDQSVEAEVPAKQLCAGDVVKVVRGSKVPADGVVVSGSVALNESMLTGESMPVTRGQGGSVIGGTVCEEGYAYCRVTKTGGQSALSQIIAMVQKAQASKPPIQDMGDKASAVFVPAVLAMSAVTFVVWMALTQSGAVPETCFMFALAVLVIACPCAVGLASPMAVVVGMGVGASHGVLIKGSAALQKAAGLTAVIFDKTGTLTQGRPQVTDFLVLQPQGSANKADRNSVLRLVASAERASEHPLARAVTSYADACGLSSTLLPIREGTFQPVSGKGLSCVIATAATAVAPSETAALATTPLEDGGDGTETGSDGSGSAGSSSARVNDVMVAVGSPSYIRAHLSSGGGSDAKASGFTKMVEDLVAGLEGSGKTAVCAAVDGQMAAVMGISDAVRPEAPEVVYALQKQGIAVWMVTGDNRLTALSVAMHLGIKPAYVMAEVLPRAKADEALPGNKADKVLPGNKADKVGELQSSGGVVAMVGDGINDAPALMQADVGIAIGGGTADISIASGGGTAGIGIAIGGGTDVAMESADMVLMRGKLHDVLTAISLSKAIFARIKINFAWAFGYNSLGIPVAMGVLFPLIRRTLPPALAGFAMAMSSVSVVLSSLMLRLYTPPRLVRRIDAKANALAPQAALADSDGVGSEDAHMPRCAMVPYYLVDVCVAEVTVATVDPECRCLCCKSCNTRRALTTIAEATTGERARRKRHLWFRRTVQDQSAERSEDGDTDAGSLAGSTDCPSCPKCTGADMLSADEGAAISGSGDAACWCRCSWCKCGQNRALAR